MACSGKRRRQEWTSLVWKTRAHRLRRIFSRARLYVVTDIKSNPGVVLRPSVDTREVICSASVAGLWVTDRCSAACALSALGAEGRRFKSLSPRQPTVSFEHTVKSTVEQLSPTRVVSQRGGAIRRAGSFSGLQSWPNRCGCRLGQTRSASAGRPCWIKSSTMRCPKRDEAVRPSRMSNLGRPNIQVTRSTARTCNSTRRVDSARRSVRT